MGLFDKKTPTQTDTTNSAGAVPGVSDTPVTGTTTQPVAQEPVVPSGAASTVVPEPVVAEPSIGTESVAGGGLSDDTSQATVSPTSVASEEPTVSAGISESVAPPVIGPMDSTPPSLGSVPVTEPSSVLGEEPGVSEVPVVPTFGQPVAVPEADDTEDTSGTGSAGSGLAG